MSFQLLFLGTGVSTAVPEIGHVLNRNCPICLEAFQNPASKNRRNNVAIALVFISPEDGKQTCIMIDAGKTMRDSCMRHFYDHEIDHVDALFITHGHADAMMGLDDLRDLQKAERAVHEPTGEVGCTITSGALPIFLHQQTMDTVKNCFGYLLNKGEYFEGTNIMKRRIALVDFRVVEQTAAVNVRGLSVKCFPGYHGGNYVSLGFSIGKAGELVYISDVKILPEESWTYLKQISPIKLLVLDCLNMHGIFSHLSLPEALQMVDELKPHRALLVGMSCTLGDHAEVCAQIAVTHPHVSLAFDGMVVDDFLL